MGTASITASITHHPISMTTTAAAALAVLAFGTVVGDPRRLTDSRPPRDRRRQRPHACRQVAGTAERRQDDDRAPLSRRDVLR